MHIENKKGGNQALKRKTGEILIDEGIITESQLQNAFTHQNKLRSYRPIGHILVDQNAISQKLLNFILDRFQKRLRLGDVLIRSGVLTQEQLNIALEYQKEKGLRLGETLVHLKFVTEEVMKQTLCTHLNIPFVNFANVVFDPKVAKLFNKNYAQKHGIVPIAALGNTMTLAMDDPTNTELVEELQSTTGYIINVVTSTRCAIMDALNNLYSGKATSGIALELELISDVIETDKESGCQDFQLKKEANSIIVRTIDIALRNSASDIHLETSERGLNIRFRIDGVLQELPLGRLQEALPRLEREVLSRIKILSKLDITEKRRPQDGSFRARVAKDGSAVNIDFRVSIVPGYYGENLVLRILDPRNAPTSINQLDFSKRLTDGLYKLLKRPSGIFLITGPTGSGKSTTLYGSLMSVYRSGIKILTAEDPIEYVYDKITQCEVNGKIGNTFAKYVRSFLRQDPDVIMIGEIRDTETANMAFRAAQTGHLVLTSLHTNDAISSVIRLSGLKVDHSLIASCLAGVLAQRLIRRICDRCKTEYTPSKELLKEFFNDPPSDIRWFKGQGCSKCNHTGYRGRLAVSELWTPSQEDAILINKGEDADNLRKSFRKNTILMAEEAMQKLRDGETNLEELLRTLPPQSIYDMRRLH